MAHVSVKFNKSRKSQITDSIGIIKVSQILYVTSGRDSPWTGDFKGMEWRF